MTKDNVPVSTLTIKELVDEGLILDLQLKKVAEELNEIKEELRTRALEKSFEGKKVVFYGNLGKVTVSFSKKRYVVTSPEELKKLKEDLTPAQLKSLFTKKVSYVVNDNYERIEALMEEGTVERLQKVVTARQNSPAVSFKGSSKDS